MSGKIVTNNIKTWDGTKIITEADLKESMKDSPEKIYETLKSMNSSKNTNHTINEPDWLSDVDMYNEYNTKRLLYNEEFQTKGIPYIFFSTPMLNFDKTNIQKDSFLSYLAEFKPELLKMLSYGSGKYCTTSPFIKLLSNMAMSFEPKDSVSKTKEVGETYYGYKLTIPAADVDSIVGDEFSVKYYDLAGLPILNLHKAWFDYHNKVRRGIFAPDFKAIQNHYIDYVSSVYFFMTEPDGQTLSYWCKLTGVAPINVPYSSFSNEWGNARDILEYSVQYVYSFKEDMNPDILLDFNKLSFNKGSLELNYNETESGNINTVTQEGTKHINVKPEEYPTEWEQNSKKHPQVVLAHRKNTNDKTKFKLIFTDSQTIQQVDTTNTNKSN